MLALAVSGSTLYAGGLFTTAGGAAANHIAAWNGSAWRALDSGLIGWVAALAVSGSTLYAGGLFTAAGGTPADNIAAWNGSAWSALGSGANDRVQALAVNGSTLYAGGDFTMAGGAPANHIAAWNGRSWSTLGSGMTGSVNALATSGSTLYAGGGFTAAGGAPANNIAAWDGSRWSALGSGTDNAVFALAVSGSTLYAGGDFTAAGGTPAKHIGAWNGSSWSPLGSGMNGSVAALAVSGSSLAAGGDFALAGGHPSAHFGLWSPGGPAGPFRDVLPTDYFNAAVNYLASHGIISGYADGSFRPYNNTTRAQLVKIVVLGFSRPPATPAGSTHTFADVPRGAPFFDVIETAAGAGIVAGYLCGGPGEPCDTLGRPYFRPNSAVTRGQLSKIAALAAGWAAQEPQEGTFADAPPGSAFYGFVETAVCHGVISGYSLRGRRRAVRRAAPALLSAGGERDARANREDCVPLADGGQRLRPAGGRAVARGRRSR